MSSGPRRLKSVRSANWIRTSQTTLMETMPITALRATWRSRLAVPPRNPPVSLATTTVGCWVAAVIGPTSGPRG